MSAEARITELGLTLPTSFSPAGSYVPWRLTGGGLLYVSGMGPLRADGTHVAGKVGATVSLEDAYAAARLVGIQLLGAMRVALGSLDRVEQIVKVLGMVNTAPAFNQTPAVINGCSDLMIEVFGDAGRHARSAVGMAELPRDICVEIELIAEVSSP